MVENTAVGWLALGALGAEVCTETPPPTSGGHKRNTSMEMEVIAEGMGTTDEGYLVMYNEI